MAKNGLKPLLYNTMNFFSNYFVKNFTVPGYGVTIVYE